MIGVDVGRLVEGVLSGDRRLLARTITQVEDETPFAGSLLSALYPHTGKAVFIGITGAPGTGKSSLVNALALHIRKQNKTVGIVAVDPSSPFSRGAVLGDRIRMSDLSGDAGVFIRSMASRGSLGGLARTTIDVVRVLDAAGFDIILIETVGAGQSEVAIAGTAHTTIVVEAPGLGDDIQATKAGILEIADILVVNKADNPMADRSVQTLKAMLDLGHRMEMVAHHGQMLLQNDGQKPPEIDTWRVPVLKTIAIQNEGIAEVYEAILAHQSHLRESGLWGERERMRLQVELADRLQTALLSRFLGDTPRHEVEQVLSQIVSRVLSPTQAVQQLLERYNNG
jgi:LAO/AO transport system kinase